MDAVAVREHVSALVTEILELDPAELDPAADFYTLGGDSLQRLELFNRLEKAYQVQFLAVETEELNTVDDLVRELCARG